MPKITAPDAIRLEILKRMKADCNPPEYVWPDSDEDLLACWVDEALVEGGLWDERAQFRGGASESSGVDSAEWSRYYECTQVATKLESGDWVGWTYWYGGGKHGDPGLVPWIDDAVYLTCTPKVVTVNTFEVTPDTKSALKKP